MTSPGGSACCGPAGETTANLTCWTFATSPPVRDSGGFETPKTGPYVEKDIFRLEKVALAYQWDVGIGEWSMFVVLGPFPGFQP